MRHLFSPPTATATATVFALLLLLVLSNGSDSFAQLNPGRMRVQNRPTVFTGATRQMLRPIRLAEAAIAEKDFDSACELLGAIVTDPSLKDCLVPNSKEWMYASSLQQQAQNLLGSMTESQRSTYREKWSARATQMLDAAIDVRDYRQIEFVAHRYLYTAAGQKATLLTGHYHLNNGRPALAASMFQQLIDIPAAQSRYAPELHLLAAVAYALSAKDKLATEQLLALKRASKDNDSDGSVTFYDSKIAIFGDDETPLDWLTEIIGASPLTAQASVVDWLVFRGDAGRNVETGPGFPLFSPRWTVETLLDDATRDDVRKGMEIMIKNKVSPIPKANLLTVNEQIVARTPNETISIDATTGKRQWRFHEIPSLLSTTGSDASDSEEQTRPNRQYFRTAKVYERLLQDAIYSHISSDRKQVFLVPNPGIATGSNDWQRYRTDRFDSPTDLKKYNSLCAIDVSADGSLTWQVGGVSGGDEPLLARSFFLGAPLPLDDGLLYSIVVHDSIVKLVVLDAATGALQWQKELASTEEAVEFTQDKVRRLAGATPSASDGIIVCPTGLNALVAVDQSTRALRWGFQFSNPDEMAWYTTDIRRDKFWRGYDKVWRDTTVTIANGSVLYTPIDSNEIYCLDLQTGRSQWGETRRRARSAERADAMYVAAVKENSIILVAPSELQAVDLLNGKRLWKIPFDSYGVVSGRGYTSGNAHYLPTTSKKLIRFDLSSNAIDKVVDTGRILGNLYPWRTDILSIGVDHIAAYPCDEASAKLFEISDTVAGTEQNAIPTSLKQHTRLAIEAQLEMQKGQYAKAAELISKAYDLFPNSTYAGVLVEVLTELIRSDYLMAERIFDRYKTLFEDRDLQRLRRGKVEGSIKSARLDEALMTILRIAESLEYETAEVKKPGESIPAEERVVLPAAEIDLVEATLRTEETAEVELTRLQWMKGKLQQIAEQTALRDDATASMNKARNVVAQHLDQYDEAPTKERFDRLRTFPRQLIKYEDVIEVAEQLYADGFLVEAHSLLAKRDWFPNSDQADDPPPSVALNSRPTAKHISRRQVLLTRLALDASAPDLAMELLKEKLDGEPIPQDTVEELENATAALVEMLAENTLDAELYLKLAKVKSPNRAPRHVLEPFQWSRYVSEITNEGYTSSRESRYLVDVQESDFKQFRKLNFRYDNAYGELQIHDALGRSVRSVYLHPDGDTEDFSSGTKGKLFIRNSVMLFCIGKEIFAIDWPKFVRGENSMMWAVRLREGTSIKNVFGSPSDQSVCYLDGSKLKCIDLFTGQTQWVRDQLPRPSTLRDSGDQVSVWNDNRHVFQTFDKVSGRRLNSGKISNLRGATSVGYQSFHLFQTPLRNTPKNIKKRGKSDESKDVDDPFADQPYTAIKLQCFDFRKGAFVWTRTMPFPAVFGRIDQRSIGVLDRDGMFAEIDIPTGDIKFEKRIEGLTDQPIVQISINRFAGRYVVIANTTKPVSNEIKLENKRVRFMRFCGRGRLNTGLMFAVSDTTGEPLWQRPVPLEKLQLLEGIPYDSPLLLFHRRAIYESDQSDNAPREQRVHVVMLDIANGALRSNHLFDVAVGTDPQCQLVCRPVVNDASDSRQVADTSDTSVKSETEDGAEVSNPTQILELTIAAMKFEIHLSESPTATQSSDEPIDSSETPAVLINEKTVKPLAAPTVAATTEESPRIVKDLSGLMKRAEEANAQLEQLRQREEALLEQETK